MAATRRTHIVRITDPDTPPDPANPSGQGNYIDVEVLDAIAFRTTGNKEVILSLDAKKSTPYIVDKTGGGHDKSPSKATQRTHMKRVQSSDGTSAIDVEIVDCWAATDQNGGSWVLDMQPGSGGGGTAYNISDGSGDAKSTRRQHNEIISVPFGKTKADAKSSYVTSVRTDNIAFRKANGHEVILSCPSCDDTNAQGVDFKRADTYTTPQGYDPNDTSANAVKPPSLGDSGDQHNYVNFVKGDDGKSLSILTQDEKIDMGPFWWIRNINQGGTWFGFIVTSFAGGSSGAARPIANAVFNDGPFKGVQFDLLNVTDGINIPDGAEWINLSSGSAPLTTTQLKQTMLTTPDGKTKVTGFGLFAFSDLIAETTVAYFSKSAAFSAPFTVTLSVTSGGFNNTFKIAPFALTTKDSKLIVAGINLYQALGQNSQGSFTVLDNTNTLFKDQKDVFLPLTTGGTYLFNLTDPANPKITEQ